MLEEINLTNNRKYFCMPLQVKRAYGKPIIPLSAELCNMGIRLQLDIHAKKSFGDQSKDFIYDHLDCIGETYVGFIICYQANDYYVEIHGSSLEEGYNRIPPSNIMPFGYIPFRCAPEGTQFRTREREIFLKIPWFRYTMSMRRATDYAANAASLIDGSLSCINRNEPIEIIRGD